MFSIAGTAYGIGVEPTPSVMASGIVAVFRAGGRDGRRERELRLADVVGISGMAAAAAARAVEPARRIERIIENGHEDRLARSAPGRSGCRVASVLQWPCQRWEC